MGNAAHTQTANGKQHHFLYIFFSPGDSGSSQQGSDSRKFHQIIINISEGKDRREEEARAKDFHFQRVDFILFFIPKDYKYFWDRGWNGDDADDEKATLTKLSDYFA